MEEILKIATKLFITIGFKSVTMDDVAAKLGMSKKTLYKHFANKEALIEASVNFVHSDIHNKIQEIYSLKKNAIEENFVISEMFREMFKSDGDSPVYQLKKHYPLIYTKVHSRESEQCKEIFEENIKKGIAGFNAASVYTPFFVLTDLDNHECPIELMNNWLPPEGRNQNLIFRIAVREIESWILSDREGFASFIDISIQNIPRNPDLEPDAKQTLINLVKKSRRRRIKEDIIPRNEYVAQGPNYNDRLMEYVLETWDINRAGQNSDRLKRAINHLNKFQTNHK